MEVEKRSYTNDFRLIQFNSFNQEFERQLPINENYRSAFEAAEEMVGKYYASYESFKATRSQRRRRG